MIKCNLLLLFLFGIISINAQIVNIPDANFKAALIADTLINTNQDNEIQVAEAEGFTGTINIKTLNISDLTGIEAFIAIRHLYCSHNQITALNLSYNSMLLSLQCSNNQLTSLDISNNTSLQNLFCTENLLNSLDVSNNISLLYLNCGWNQISILDVSNNHALEILSCDSNNISTLDINNNVNLTGLDCSSNSISTLDVSNNLALESISCSSNLITYLDLSDHPLLNVIICSNNHLNYLNVKNGNNTSVGNYFFRAEKNPNLYCIEVDDAIWSATNWTIGIDTQSYYNEYCTSNLKNELENISINVYPNPTSDLVIIETQNIERVEVMNIHGELLYNYSTKDQCNAYKINFIQNPGGVYIIKAISDKQTIFRKLIKP